MSSRFILVFVVLHLLLSGLNTARADKTPPALVIPDLPLGSGESRLAPNLLINLSLTFDDAGAAHRGPYEAGTEYAGYFNAALCYLYPMKERGRVVRLPDLEERSGYFSPSKASDGAHGCGGDSFSGNFLNWASSTTLDLLRLGLTGGDRVIDETGRTVLQRAWLPDGAVHPDFYAHPLHFPRKSLSGELAAAATPFAGETLYVVSCRNRILFSTTRKGSSCDAPRFGAAGARLVSDKFHGEFNARVLVCTPDDAALRPRLCQAYGAAFKPEGALQRGAGAAKVGLMSYLTGAGAQDGAQYGGVLRAPLKFIGALAYKAPRYEAQPNPDAEWDVDTGRVAVNPDNAAGGLSGAINYINRLGRSDPARPGVYKAGDPGAELYYEALRYLQGRAPSVGSAAVDAGFPVWRKPADPIDASCQRNVIATIGHPSFHDDRYLPGNTRTGHNDQPRSSDTFAAPALFDVMDATRRVGLMEADPGRVFGNRAPRADLLGLDLRDDGPDGAGSYYLAGAAYWAHTHAIRPDFSVTVASMSLELGAGAAGAASALYLAAKYGAFDDRNDDANPYVTTNGRRDDSEWTAEGGAARGYFAAPGAQDVTAAARALIEAALQPAGGIKAGPAVASAMRKGAGFLIQASYDSSSWRGSLQRRSVSVAAGSLQTGPRPDWDAALLLAGDAAATPPVPPRLPPEARKIYTLDDTPGKPPVTIAFLWNALPPALRALLDVPAPDGVADGQGEARTAFLRGDRRQEQGGDGTGAGLFRRRGGVLGDIVNSVPLLVGEPSAAVQGESYADFHNRYKGRRQMVYVGANDGMLHAFDTVTGMEAFAYIPRALLAQLSVLSAPGYLHRPFVDASAASAEVRINTTWRSVLVSGMGQGARGVFALDITDPAAFGAGQGALWEFTERDDPAIGHVSAPPRVAKLQIGSKAAPLYRYFAVVASGINPLAGDGALFLLALDKPAGQAWKRNLNYYRFALPSGESKLANVLSPPALALAGDGALRHAYAGDLLGRLWRFDFTGKPPWSGALGPGAGSKPLFTARDDEGARQPIAHAPRVVFAPDDTYLVLFATGKFMEASDLERASYASQSLYAIHDSLADPPVLVGGRGELAERKLSSSGQAYALNGAPVDFSGPDARKGWYVDFLRARSDGERAAASPLGVAGAVIFDTVIPGADACSAPSSRSYMLDAGSGLALGRDGLPRSGEETGTASAAAPTGVLPLLVSGGLVTGPRDATGRASVSESLALVRLKPDGQVATQRELKVASVARRLGWREVANWQELHDAVKK